MNTQTADDSFRDFRSFLVELLYAYPSLRHSIFSILFDIVRGQGLKLTGLLKQLRQTLEGPEDVEMKEEISDKPGSSKEVEDEETKTKEFPLLRVLSSKRYSPKQMLRSLNVISHVRNQLSKPYKNNRAPTEVSKYFTAEDADKEEKLLHSVLDDLADLWDILSYCLEKISHSKDNRAVMGLQNAAEAFFLLYSLAIPNPAIQQQQATSTQDGSDPVSIILSHLIIILIFSSKLRQQLKTRRSKIKRILVSLREFLISPASTALF